MRTHRASTARAAIAASSRWAVSSAPTWARAWSRGPMARAASTCPRTCVPSPTCTSVRRMTAVVHQPTVCRDRGGAGVPGARHDSSTRGQQQRDDDQRHQHVHGDDPGGEVVGDDAAAEPALETGEQHGGDDRPQDARLAPMMPPGRDGRGQDDEPDGDAEQPVQVLRPHQRRVELRRVEAGRQVGGRGRRNPRSEATRPVGTPQAGARRPHQSADGDQEIGDGGGGNRQALERGGGHQGGRRSYTRLASPGPRHTGDRPQPRGRPADSATVEAGLSP